MTATATRAATASSGGELDLDFALNAKQYDFVYDDEHKFVAYIGGLG